LARSTACRQRACAASAAYAQRFLFREIVGMGVPAERAITFTAALILGVIAVFIIVGFVIRLLLGTAVMGMI